MDDKDVRAEIAFIKNALEEGRSYARLRSPDFTVWGAAIAIGYFGTYAYVRHVWSVEPRLMWLVLVVCAWGFSLRRLVPKFLSGAKSDSPAPMIQTLRALWLGYGVTASLLALLSFGQGRGASWFDAVTAGMLGLCFFASAAASSISWLRVVALGWWGAAIVLFLLRDRVEVLLAGGIFMIALLFLPGLVLWLRRPPAHG